MRISKKVVAQLRNKTKDKNVIKLQKTINETAKEDWEDYKKILKDDFGIDDIEDYIRDSSDIGSGGDNYDNIIWSAGYISGLKKAKRLYENK